MADLRESSGPRFDVGGYWQDRPFRVRRLGHLGLNCMAMEESVRFYRDLLGFRVSDRIDFAERAENPADIADFGDPGGYFMRYGSDHHSFVLFNRRVREFLDKTRNFPPGVTVNQISWQVGSLAEIINAEQWLREHGYTIQRTGRDMPGSNWHTYFYDPEGHTNELFYGMEQVGWTGRSKPRELYRYGARTTPSLPQPSETEEVSTAIAEGIAVDSGSRIVPDDGPRYEVGGVLLSRPFKVVRIGPLRLFMADVEGAKRFYQSVIGLTVTEEFDFEGAHCVLLRANTEHHSVGLYPIELRERLGLGDSTTFSVGMQVSGYRQLRDAREYLRQHKVEELKLPAGLFPGLGRALRVQDPDGHVIELYDAMQQVIPTMPAPPEGYDDDWPETIEDDGGFLGEPYFGPLE